MPWVIRAVTGREQLPTRPAATENGLSTIYALKPEMNEKDDSNRRLVAGWLFSVCAMLLVMAALGGATRLTGSGLSIMEWAPMRGVLPPLNDAEWNRLFALYQQIPQYHLMHEGFGIEGFKRIFWLEWTHRLWGRLIGVAFLIPLVVLWRRGAVDRWMRVRLLVFFALGALQGAIGWFMVASGFFPESTAVSAYRLVIHLVLALVLYAAILWTALSFWQPVPEARVGAWLRRLAGLCAALVSITTVTGGFVAGLRAGQGFNTFPLMGDGLVPPGYASLEPFLRNLTENWAAVQFDHRLLATLTATLVLATVALGLRTRPPRSLRRALLALGVLVVVQYALGVVTLLWFVPVVAGTAHQVVAVLVLMAAVAALHASRPILRHP